MPTRIILTFLMMALWAGHAAHAGSPRENRSSTITDDQLQSFAAAVMELSAIERRYAPRLQAALGTELDQLHERAGERMISAIQDSGISVSTFNRIVAQADRDEEMADRIDLYVRRQVTGRLH